MKCNYGREQRGEQDLMRRRVKNRSESRSVKVLDERVTRSIIGYLGRAGWSGEAPNGVLIRKKYGPRKPTTFFSKQPRQERLMGSGEAKRDRKWYRKRKGSRLSRVFLVFKSVVTRRMRMGEQELKENQP